MPAPLPILSTATKVLRVVFSDIRTLMRLALLPLVISMGALVLLSIEVADTLQQMPGASSGDASAAMPIGGNGILLFALVYVIAAVLFVPTATAWHRFIVLGPENPNARVRYSWHQEETRYLLRALLLFGIAAVVFFGAGAIGSVFATEVGLPPQPVAALLALLTACLVLRLSLTLPAAAVGHDADLGRAFLLTRGNGMRIVAIAVLVVMPYLIGAILLNMLVTQIWGAPMDGTQLVNRKAFVIGQAVGQIWSIIGFGFYLTLLSGCYYDLMGRHA